METPKKLTSKSQKERKGYQKPAVVHREMIENVAGTCGDNDPVNGKSDPIFFCTTTFS